MQIISLMPHNCSPRLSPRSYLYRLAQDIICKRSVNPLWLKQWTRKYLKDDHGSLKTSQAWTAESV